MRPEKALADEIARIGRLADDERLTLTDLEALSAASWALAWALGWPDAKAPSCNPRYRLEDPVGAS